MSALNVMVLFFSPQCALDSEQRGPPPRYYADGAAFEGHWRDDRKVCPTAGQPGNRRAFVHTKKLTTGPIPVPTNLGIVEISFALSQ